MQEMDLKVDEDELIVSIFVDFFQKRCTNLI